MAAFRAALDEYNRDEGPFDWAMTQDNIGIALAALGERESGTRRLEEAAAAFREAHKIYAESTSERYADRCESRLNAVLAALGKRKS